MTRCAPIFFMPPNKITFFAEPRFDRFRQENTGRVGDYVLIRQARPHSRKKHFEIYNTVRPEPSN